MQLSKNVPSPSRRREKQESPKLLRRAEAHSASEMPAYIPLCGTSARQFRFAELVGVTGLEPVTCRLSSGCSNQLSYTPRLRAYALRRGQPDNFKWLAEPKLAAKRRAKAGGADGARTRDPQLAKLVLYQLSYSPTRPDRASAIGSCWWLL